MEINAVLLFQVGIILLSTKALGEFLGNRKLPPMVGEVLAGIVLGPFVLGWVQPSESITMLANFGIICLLFLIGLNSEYKKLLQVGWIAVAVALGGVLLPLGMSMLLIPGIAGVVIGAALTGTSISVVMRMLKDTGKLSSPEGKIVTTASVLDDIIGVIVLAVVTGAAGASLFTLGVLTIKTVVFLALALLAAVALTMFWKMKALEIKRSVHDRTLLPLFLGVCFVLAWFAVQFQLAALIGAFVAGVIFSEIHDKKMVVQELQPFFDVFVPIFFFVIGMSVNPALVLQGGWLVLMILGIAFFSKIVGCGVPALLRLSASRAFVVGLSMVPRLEVALIIMGSALSANLVGADAYSAFVVVALVSLAVVPPAISMVYAYHPKHHL